MRAERLKGTVESNEKTKENERFPDGFGGEERSACTYTVDRFRHCGKVVRLSVFFWQSEEVIKLTACLFFERIQRQSSRRECSYSVPCNESPVQCSTRKDEIEENGRTDRSEVIPVELKLVSEHELKTFPLFSHIGLVQRCEN